MLTSVIHFIWVQDSPRFNACARGKFFYARVLLEKIANFSKRPIFCETLEGEKVIGYTENTENFTTPDF